MGPSIKNWKPFKRIYVNGAAYGGLIANIHSLVKFGQELLKENNSLLKNNSKHLFFAKNTIQNGTTSEMGLSWFHGNLKKHNYIAHAGGGGGFYCELRLYPDLKRGSFVVFNRSGFKDEKFLNKIDLYFLKD